jgi:hypothetical protein
MCAVIASASNQSGAIRNYIPSACDDEGAETIGDVTVSFGAESVMMVGDGSRGEEVFDWRCCYVVAAREERGQTTWSRTCHNK